MTEDASLEAVRAVREKISSDHGDSPRALVEHYMEYQARFGDRLRFVKESGDEPGDPVDAGTGNTEDPAARVPTTLR